MKIVLIFIHHKWKRSRVLSWKGECRSCLTNCQVTQELQSYEIRKFQETPWNDWVWYGVFSSPLTKQNLTVVLQNCKKLAVKHFIQKPILLKVKKSVDIA